MEVLYRAELGTKGGYSQGITRITNRRSRKVLSDTPSGPFTILLAWNDPTDQEIRIRKFNLSADQNPAGEAPGSSTSTGDSDRDLGGGKHRLRHLASSSRESLCHSSRRGSPLQVLPFGESAGIVHRRFSGSILRGSHCSSLWYSEKAGI